MIFCKRILLISAACLTLAANACAKATSEPATATSTTSGAIPLSPTQSTLIPHNAHLDVKCLEIPQALPSSLDTKGSIVLTQKANPEQTYLWNLKTEQKFFLESGQNELLLSFATSPDGKWLALDHSIQNGMTTTSSSLEIRTSTGDIYATRKIDVGTFISRWLNNDQLILRHGFSPSSVQVAINPFTGIQQELKTDFPDFVFDIQPTSDWENQSVVVYDPSLTRVVYAGDPSDYVLVDAINNSSITRISPAPVLDNAPKWSPDGGQFVISYADILNPINDPKNWTFELYSVSRSGQFEQLTHVSEYYNHPRIRSYKWSPDGRKIAFWLEPNPIGMGGMFNLAVLNMDTGNVTNYCVTSWSKGIPPLFWSPDGKQLILETFNKNREEATHLLLVDIENGWAAQIGENLTPTGWMTNE